MPNSARPTLITLRGDIKTEARVKGSDNLDEFIDNLVNELILDYAQKNLYFELLVTNHPIQTVAGTGHYALPADFMKARLVRYTSASGSVRTLNERSGFVHTAMGGRPNYYELSGDSILVYPYPDIVVGETILFDYYKFPDTLTDDSPFPIPKLVPTVRMEAVHRVHIYMNQMQQAAALKSEASENEQRTVAIGTP